MNEGLTGLEQHEGETVFSFWVNYSLNTSLMKRHDNFIWFNELIKLELNQFDEQI